MYRDSVLDGHITPGITRAPSVPVSAADPRTILTIKSRDHKALHITQFLSEATLARRRRRQDVFLTPAGEAGQRSLAVQTEDGHPYRGITVEEWGATNMRLFNQLLATGQLTRDCVEYYLAYTAIIFDFAQKYD